MKSLVKVAMLAIIVVTQGCATYGRISGTPLGDQKSVYKDGRKTLISIKQSSVAIIVDPDFQTSV